MSSKFELFLDFCIRLSRKDDDEEEDADVRLIPFCFAPEPSVAKSSMASTPLTTTALTASVASASVYAASASAAATAKEDRKLQLLQRLRLRVKMNLEQRKKIFRAAKKFEEDGDDETALECYLFCLEGRGEKNK